MPKAKKLKQYTLDNVFIKEFDSVSAANKTLKISYPYLVKILKSDDNIDTRNKFIFKYSTIEVLTNDIEEKISEDDKKCSKCNTIKKKTEFSKNKKQKDGYGAWCKVCMTAYRNMNLDKRHEYDKKFREKHHETELERQKKYREENQEKIHEYNEKNKDRKKEADRLYRENNKDKKRESNKLYREKNAEKIKQKKKEEYEKNKNKPEFKEKIKLYQEEHKEEIAEQRKKYREEHKEEIKEKYQKNKKKDSFKQRRRKYQNNKLKNDINYKLYKNISHRIRLAIKADNNAKSEKTLKLLGCSIEFVRKHLEKNFTEEMTWENHGKIWQIDHIIPCAFFKFSDPKQQEYCFNYKNLQPLTCEENNLKADKLPEGIELPVFE